MDRTQHRVATKEREEIKGSTKQKIARRHSKGGNHLEPLSYILRLVQGDTKKEHVKNVINFCNFLGTGTQF